MSAEQISQYPHFYRYVRCKMPEVQEVGAIIGAIKSLSGAVSRATIQKSLRWGEDPIITVVTDLGADGEFTFGAGSNEIRIDEDRVLDFESGMSDRRGRFKRHLGRVRKNGRLVYIVGVILLHELTHWSDDQDGVDDPDGPEGEEGWSYESAVYGSVDEPWSET